MAVIAIDFDDTLQDRSNVLPGYRMGQPTRGAILATQRIAQDHTIIIFTARRVQDPRVYKAVEDWLNHFQIPHSGITNIKRPEFEVYIDNRALRFNGDWANTLADLKRLESGRSPANAPKETQLIDDITKPM